MGTAPLKSAAGKLGGVLCAGNIVHDLIVRPVEQVAWGTSTWVEDLEGSLGGNGANTAYALALLGVPARLLSAVGDDSAGTDLLRRLRGVGVDVRCIVRSSAATAATVVLVNRRGERCFLHRPGVISEAFLDPIEFTPHVIEGVSHFHLANLFALPRLMGRVVDLMERARAAGLTTSLDTGWDSSGAWRAGLVDALNLLDFLFVNEAEACRLTGEKASARAVAKLRDSGADVVVLKLAERGCLISEPRRETRIPAFDVVAVDTTGAGDCFAAGFLAALHRGYSLTECGRMANAVAALSVRCIGAVAGLRSWKETEDWAQNAPVIERRDIQHEGH